MAPAPALIENPEPGIVEAGINQDMEESNLYFPGNYSKSGTSPVDTEHKLDNDEPGTGHASEILEDEPMPERAASTESAREAADEILLSVPSPILDQLSPSTDSFQSLEEESDEDAIASQLQLEQRQHDSSLDEVDVAAELATQLFQFQGCSTEAHNTAQAAHNNNQEEDIHHYSLRDLEPVFGRLPNILGDPKIMKHKSPIRNQPPDWRYIFEGQVDEEDLDPIRVCLPCSEQVHRPIHSRFDFDSILGFAQSLGFAKRGIMVNLAPQFSTNIQTNLHLSLPVTYTVGQREHTRQVSLHKIPHYRLGRLIGHGDVDVYIFFPQQWSPDKPTNFPGKEAGEKHGVLRKWTDDILLPSIARWVDSDTGQHLPASWQNALLQAQAHNRETHALFDKSESSYHQLHFPLQPQILHNIWLSILDKVEQPGYRHYQGAQLFFSSKGSKLIYKSQTLSGAWQKLSEQLEYSMDFTYISQDKLWLDLGKETSCTDWSLPLYQLPPSQSPATYLWRPCCLEAFYQWLQFGKGPRGVRRDYYTTAMLDQAGEIRVEMAPSTLHSHNGWVFSQLYNSNKELYDAAKTKPFRSAFLSKLAWDMKTRAMIDKQGGSRTATTKQLEGSYCRSKIRLANCLHSGFQKSYGIREEHRISLALLHRIRIILEQRGNWSRPVDCSQQIPPFWELSTDTYVTFLKYNTNKFLFAFEWILTSADKRFVSYEHSKVLAMLLQGLRHSYDSTALSGDQGLWKDVYEQGVDKHIVHGMGLGTTMKRSGYGWLLPKVDWSSMTFETELSRKMVYHNRVLRDSHRKQWQTVRDTKDDLGILEFIGDLFIQYGTNDSCRYSLKVILVALLLRRFRKDVFQSLEKDIRPEFRAEALAGQVSLCQSSLEKVLLPQQHDRDLASINVVCSNRSKLRTVASVANLFWDFDDGYVRTNWAQRSYRLLYQRALVLVRIACGEETAAELQDLTKRLFIAHTWMIPYASNEKFFVRSSSGSRRWISVYHRDWVHTYKEGDEIDPTLFWSATGSDGRIHSRHLSCMKGSEWHTSTGKQNRVFMREWALTGEDTGVRMRGRPSLPPIDDCLNQDDILKVGQVIEQEWENLEGSDEE
jgi:hypothetical protein